MGTWIKNKIQIKPIEPGKHWVKERGRWRECVCVQQIVNRFVDQKLNHKSLHRYELTTTISTGNYRKIVDERVKYAIEKLKFFHSKIYVFSLTFLNTIAKLNTSSIFLHLPFDRLKMQSFDCIVQHAITFACDGLPHANISFKRLREIVQTNFNYKIKMYTMELWRHTTQFTGF